MKKLCAFLAFIFLMIYASPAYAAGIDDSVWEKIEESFYTSPIEDVSEIDTSFLDDSSPQTDSSESSDALQNTENSRLSLDPDTRLYRRYRAAVDNSSKYQAVVDIQGFCRRLLNGQKLSDMSYFTGAVVAQLLINGEKSDANATLYKTNGAWTLSSYGRYQDSLELTEEIKKQLTDSGLALENTTAESLSVSDAAEGVLFADGNQEFFLCQKSDYLDTGRLYSTRELAEAVLPQAEKITEKYPEPTVNLFHQDGTPMTLEEIQWDLIEDSFYSSTIMNSDFYDLNDQLAKDGYTLNRLKVFSVYDSVPLNGIMEENKANAAAFCQKLLDGEPLYGLISDSGFAYGALQKDGEDIDYAYAYLGKEKNGSWSVWGSPGAIDEGGSLDPNSMKNTDRLDLTDELKSALLSSGLDLTKTVAKAVNFYGVDILFTDGENEFLWVEEPGRDLLAMVDYDTVYHTLRTPKEIAELVMENLDEIYQPVQTDENGIPNTGGGSEEEVVPESEKFSPLWLIGGLTLAFFATELTLLKRRKIQAKQD